MNHQRIALLTFDRDRALGQPHRIATWDRLVSDVGASLVHIRLLADHHSRLARGALPDGWSVVRGRAVPESLAWSWSSAREAVRASGATLSIALTARACSPHLLDEPFVLDHVDHLSRNYLERSRMSTDAARRRLPLRLLAPTHSRFETWATRHIERRVAAGYADSERLGATWIPILAPEPRRGSGQREVDLLFFGNLSYEPNVSALLAFARLWPELQRRRPKTTMLVAGRYPSKAVTRLCRDHGWRLEIDFDDPAELCSTAAIGIAPLPIATGIQTKVLEAAAYGLPQVISSVAARGFGPHVPAAVASDDTEFLSLVIELLEDERARQVTIDHAAKVIAEHYSVAAWRARVSDLLDIA